MEQNRKKRVLIHSDFPLALTGFGKNNRNMLEHLYATNKYELANLAVGTIANSPECSRTPWKTFGTVEPSKIEALRNQNDPKNWDGLSRMAGYGQFALDECVKTFKPDVLISCQDIWGIDFALQSHWFDKITCVQWTTLDSLPILDKAILAAKKSKNFWSWADFATKAMHKMGHEHVKTVRGSINTKDFFRLPDYQKQQLRKVNGIDQDTFVIGFVFRNQLRKSVPNLIHGFKLFKEQHPKLKTKLLLHTSWIEGWNIQKLLSEYGLQISDVITTYVCRNCNKYEVKSFSTNDENCRFCNSAKSQTTTGPGFGVDEPQLNEIYNLMDVYCHPFTSGGQEIPIQEAKMCQLLTLVTNYSCGEDACEPDAGSLPLDWHEYREADTQFIKATTLPSSIAKQLTKVLEMKPERKKEMGLMAREWVIKNFSIDTIGKFLETFIDEQAMLPNPDFVPSNEADDDKWLKDTYLGFLGQKLDESSPEFAQLKNVQ